MKRAYYIFFLLAITFFLVLRLCSCQEYDDEPSHLPAHITGELLLKLNGINRELRILRRTTPGGSDQLQEKEIVLHFALQKFYHKRYILNEETGEPEGQIDEAPAHAGIQEPKQAEPQPSDQKQGKLQRAESSLAGAVFFSSILRYAGFSRPVKVGGLNQRGSMLKRRNKLKGSPGGAERVAKSSSVSGLPLSASACCAGSLLDVATMYNYSEIARALIAHGVSCYEINERGEMPLLRAIERGHYCLALELIEHGNPYGFRDAEGRTFLHVLLNARWNPGIRRLIRHADLDFLQVSDQYGLTPLHIATFLGDDVTVRRLLQRDVTRDVHDNKGRAPLHCAVFAKNIEIVRILVLKGARADVFDREGNTPLHYAVKMNCLEIIEFLLEAGADCEQKNRRGFTPVALAGKFGTFQMVRLLAQSSTFDRECCVCFEEKRRCVAPCPENCSHWLCAACLESMVHRKPQCRRCPASEDAQKVCTGCEKNFEAVFSECPDCCDVLQWQCTNCSEIIKQTPNCLHCQAPLRDQSLFSRLL